MGGRKTWPGHFILVCRQRSHNWVGRQCPGSGGPRDTWSLRVENGGYGPEWRGRFLLETLFTVFLSRFAGAVRFSPHFQRFSSAPEAPTRWV
jgi:hypothetical protein